MNTLQFIKQNTEKILNYSVLGLLILLFLRLAIYNFQMVVHPFPLEYREGVHLVTTNLLLAGGNPYDLANQPNYTNIYGIFYPIVVYPFAKLFGATMIVHRIVSSLFIWASCYVLFLVMRRMKISLVLAFIGALILYWHLLLGLNYIAGPNSLGLFLFICSIAIPWRYRYSFKSLVISLFLSILAYMAKPYFILGIPYVAAYIFIFKSKKQGIRYGLLSLIYMGITILLLDFGFEVYFNNTFFVYLNVKIAGTAFEYVVSQIITYTLDNFALIIILIISLLVAFKQLAKYWKQIKLIEAVKAVKKLNLFEPREPLIKINCDIFLFSLICSLIIFCLKLGQFSGTWMGYMYHLISPFFIIVAIHFAPKLTARALILFLFVVSINLFFIFPESRLNNDTAKEWNKIIELISQHQNIFNSPVIAPILVEQGKKVYDNGHSEYYINGAERQILNISLGADTNIKNRYKQFMQEINDSVNSKKYDLIVLTKTDSSFIIPSSLTKCYELKETLPVTMVVQNWPLDVWEPKKSACN